MNSIQPFIVDELSCVVCGDPDAPYTVKLAGMKTTQQLCQDCREMLAHVGDLKIINEEEVLFDIVKSKGDMIQAKMHDHQLSVEEILKIMESGSTT